MRIIFAGTPDFAATALRSILLAKSQGGDASFEVVAVYTQPDRKVGRGKKLTPPPVKVLAQEHDIPTFQPHSLAEQTEQIESLNADVMVVVAYGMLLPQPVLDAPKYGCINIHASLLPRWRGAAPIQRAIEAGDTHTGVSIMKMEIGLDTGPVYLSLPTPISEGETNSSLHERLAELGAQGIVQILNKLAESGECESTEQDSQHANYAHKITKLEADIDWALTAAKIERKIRALQPWPVCQTYNGEDRLRVWQASVRDGVNTLPTPGTVTSVSKQGIEVACGENALLIQVVQKDGSKTHGRWAVH